MARRHNQLNVYLEDDLYDEIEDRAADAEMSMSRYAAEVLESHVQNQLAGEINQQSAVERRLEELAAHAAEEITDATGGLEEAILQGSIHSIATWELVKTGHGEVQQQQAIQAGSERVREEADVLGIDPATSTEPTTSGRSSTNPDATTRSDPDTGPDYDDDEWYC